MKMDGARLVGWEEFRKIQFYYFSYKQIFPRNTQKGSLKLTGVLYNPTFSYWQYAELWERFFWLVVG